MKRKLISAVVLVVIALAVLFLALEPADDGYYFRDSTLIPAENGLAGDYFDFPWASEADLSDHAALLPELDGYSVTEFSGRYAADGSLWGLHVQWNGTGESCILLLDILAEKPQDLAWARLHVMDYDRVTATQVDDVTVYGDGTERSGRVLEFTAADGVFYQISGTRAVSSGDLARVLDFCLEDRIDLNAFAKVDCGYYFRDNRELVFQPDVPNVVYQEDADKRMLGDADRETLEEAEVLPRLPSYDNFSGDVFYRDGEVYVILMSLLHWPVDGEDPMRQIDVRIYPDGRSGTAEELYQAGISIMDPEQVTVTEMNGITVYGDGTPDTQLGRILGFTGRDGAWYQLFSNQSTPMEELGTVLDFYMQKDVDLRVFGQDG